ncbi:hypothetical protein JKP88DRAFT_277082 [Tribonema minus]|uniref:DUF659 domain-containing protein n=1 Tax=Tribonema minus TaxID=303371 RepID=A0A835Z0G7_9STRA|nr:hypothetical protein JKP88DRAFT_277082 [Tribonema minus]
MADAADPGPDLAKQARAFAAAVAAAEAAAAAAAAAGDGEEEVESGVAFHLIEQEDLVAAFAALGADLPNRKALAGTMLNKEHDRVSRDVWEAIDALHLGGSYFVTTEPARGVCKNAEWIEELHMRWAKKVTRGNLDRLLGMVMDNTKANRKALDLMKQKHPTWLLLGCQAHALALLIKDLHGEKNARCDWSRKAYGKALMMSNTINGSETIHSALREQQKFKYGKVKAVRSHCPTRFAILHFICSDLLDSEEAIKLMVGDRSWGHWQQTKEWETDAYETSDRDSDEDVKAIQRQDRLYAPLETQLRRLSQLPWLAQPPNLPLAQEAAMLQQRLEHVTRLCAQHQQQQEKEELQGGMCAQCQARTLADSRFAAVFNDKQLVEQVLGFVGPGYWLIDRIMLLGAAPTADVTFLNKLMSRCHNRNGIVGRFWALFGVYALENVNHWRALLPWLVQVAKHKSWPEWVYA